MTILNINSNGGTCDRCGKALVNVAVISDEAGTHSVGLDCLAKVEVSDFQTKRQLRNAVKDARELAQLKKIVKQYGEGSIISWDVKNDDGQSIWYYRLTATSRKVWVGLAEQNTKDLRKEIWELVTQGKNW